MGKNHTGLLTTFVGSWEKTSNLSLWNISLYFTFLETTQKKDLTAERKTNSSVGKIQSATCVTEFTSLAREENYGCYILTTMSRW